MTRIAVMTKSYAPDFEMCTALNRSVLDNTASPVIHQIIVPRSDLALFGSLAGPRTHIRCDAEFLPGTFVHLKFANVAVNLRRPFPPVRGWIQQQIVKLAAVAESAADAVILADSDVEFIRTFDDGTFVRDGTVRFFCDPGRIGEGLQRHMTWHRVARRLLGLPPAQPPFADYITSPISWDPRIVRSLLERVAATAEEPWATAVAGQIDFSECVLYGVYVDSVRGAPDNSFASGDPLCLSYWKHEPLDQGSAAGFIGDVRPTDIAAMIPSKSQTLPALRKQIFDALRAKQTTTHWPNEKP